MIKKGDARKGHTPRKSIPGHLEKPSSSLSQLYAKLRYFSYRFLHEATNSISCRFLCEATGRALQEALIDVISHAAVTEVVDRLEERERDMVLRVKR